MTYFEQIANQAETVHVKTRSVRENHDTLLPLFGNRMITLVNREIIDPSIHDMRDKILVHCF
jgi:hypothetical protein